VGVIEQEAIRMHQPSWRVGFLHHAVDDDLLKLMLRGLYTKTDYVAA
jgi:hypothetical protein